MIAAGVPEAGWYPDPRGSLHAYRWWDGTAWTSLLTDDPTEPEPEPETTPGNTDAVVASADPAPLDPARTAAYERRARDPARRARPVRLVAGVAVAVLALAVSLVVVLRSDGTVRNARPLAPPSPVPSSLLTSYNQTSRRVQVGEVVATFPGTPWSNDPLPAGHPIGLLSTGVGSSTVVHADYDGSSDWGASIFLGAADPRIVRAGDGTATAETAFRYARSSFYVGVDTTADQPKLSMNNVQGRAIAGLQTVVRYRLPKLASRGDRVTVLVIAPRAGSSDPPVIWLSLRPTDSPTAVADGLQQALDSLTFG